MPTPVAVWVRVESTTLTAAAYESSGQQLELDFRDGTRYRYCGVASDLFSDLLCAASKGSFFNQYIRDRFPYAKLPAKK